MAYKVNKEICIQCGACVASCPMGAIELQDDGSYINPDMCIECGACASVCPVQAIALDEGTDNEEAKEEIEEKEDLKVSEEKPDYKLLHFFAEWCGPCKAIEPELAKLSSDLPDLKIEHINIDENMEEPAKYNVMSIPTLVLLKDGEQQATIVGFKNANELKKEIKKWL